MNTDPDSGEGDPLGQWHPAVDLKNSFPACELFSAQYSPLLSKQRIKPNDNSRALGNYHLSILKSDKTKCSQ